jgi:hypothetical protein
MTDTKADDLVTAEMVKAAGQALCDYQGDPSGRWNYYEEEARFALRAVAPMIAARAVIDKGYRDLQAWRDGNEVGRAAEREACAKIAEGLELRWEQDWRRGRGVNDQLRGGADAANVIAAAIRARGET